MNIIVFHRIPFPKIRYDRTIDHGEHTVRYLCPAGDADLPEGAERRLLDVPTHDVETIARVHGDWLSEADRVIARSEYDLLPAARLRERFGIPGDLPETVMPVRDKWLMRKLAGEAGVAQPAYWSVDDFRAAPPAGGRYLIKPRLEASSEGILVGDREQILQWLSDGRDLSELFVEEFVPGRIWHFDGCLSDGEIAVAVSSAYVGDCLEFAHGSPLGSQQLPDEPAGMEMVRVTLDALGQRHGAFHFEAIQDEDGRFLFLETAARVGAGGIAETFALRTGVELYQADLHYGMHGTVGPLRITMSDEHYGWFIFPAHHRPDLPPLDFDPERYGDRLHSYVYNPRPAAHVGRISYATTATPLSGVVRGGTYEQVLLTLEEICALTEVVPQP